MSDTVEPWSKRQGLFHPRLTLTVALGAEQVLDDLAAALGREKFKVKGRDAAGLTTRRTDYLGFVVGHVNWTTLDVKVAEGTTATSTTLRVQGDHEGHDVGRKQAATALSAVVARWRASGTDVEIGPWEIDR